MLLNALESCLLVIDIQDKLLTAMDDAQGVLANTSILMRGAGRLDVPALVSEQYPKGLGPTNADLTALTPPGDVVEKLSFSCAGEPAYMTRLRGLGRRQLVITGIEAHVCVLQTALDLTAQGFKCFVVADAVSSRLARNRDLALTRMRDNGCQIVSTEMVLFEWLQAAGSDEFKELSKLVR
ncbi:MAG: hydrolase [Rhodospirillaceae bacterium]|jgi:nicotinamidase-related amidase|nr:hydrolase [Rhodospirillaceae bacterium]MBT5373204.1 hydrolase [Rhodospirillaceae bacterium]MBT5659237.1 hydrolase [Rhodospirillaceae bacterium]MBT5751967.1 hydrolase [Rhodospirillaceae bacterium]